jgi:hypothetical protein
MASLDFFGIGDDLQQVIEFILAETDFRIFDSYSEFGRELREYRSVSELTAVHDIGVDHHGHGAAVLLKLG